MYDVKQLFAEMKMKDSFRRVDKSHPLDLYVGIDSCSRYTLFIMTDKKPKCLNSSQIINVQVGLREDNLWVLSFTLINSKFTDIFCHFCKDIIESSRYIDKDDEKCVFVCSRYLKWQNMFSRSKGELLSENEIKGLIGELIFLNEYLIPQYGGEKSLDAWIGPENAKQDFVIDDIWYEVKTVTTGSESIRISSVEQIDVEQVGELVILYLDKTSNADIKKITINKVFNETLTLLSTEILKQKLIGILIDFGYFYREEYEEYTYKMSKMNRYSVTKEFPRLRRKELSKAIIDANYKLSISFISDFLWEE